MPDNKSYMRNATLELKKEFDNGILMWLRQEQSSSCRQCRQSDLHNI